MPRPILSIILPTRNNAASLPTLLDFIIQQLDPGYELIVVDGASQDETQRLLQAYQEKEARLKVVQLSQDKGSGAARNAGLRASRGRFIAFQDDTCLPHPTRFTRQLYILEHDPQVDLVFSSLAWVDQEQNIHRVSPSLVERGEFPPHPEHVFQVLYLEGNQAPTSSLMFRRELLEKYGRYPESPLGCEEWLQLLEWSARGVRMHAIPEPLISRQLHSAKPASRQQARQLAQAERETLRQVQAWLKREGITRFKNLHRHAWSNQYLRESRLKRGPARLLLRLRAVLACPTSRSAWKKLRRG